MANRVANDGNNVGTMVGENKGSITIVQNTTQYNKLPSLIGDIIQCFSDVCLSDDETAINDVKPFTHDEKLEYNHIIKYKEIIMDYSIFWQYCENALNLYDNSNMGAKKKILLCVKTWYSEIKGDFFLKTQNKKLSQIEIIRNNSDLIIDMIKCKIANLIKDSDSKVVTSEDIELGINCFICYCFMQCRILEKPL